MLFYSKVSCPFCKMLVDTACEGGFCGCGASYLVKPAGKEIKGQLERLGKSGKWVSSKTIEEVTFFRVSEHAPSAANHLLEMPADGDVSEMGAC